MMSLLLTPGQRPGRTWMDLYRVTCFRACLCERASEHDCVSVGNRVGVLGGECVGFQKYVIYPVRSVIWIVKK